MRSNCHGTTSGPGCNTVQVLQTGAILDWLDCCCVRHAGAMALYNRRKLREAREPKCPALEGVLTIREASYRVWVTPCLVRFAEGS